MELLIPIENDSGTHANMIAGCQEGLASTVLDDKIYAIGGVGLSSLKFMIRRPINGVITANLPKEIDRACAVSLDGKDYYDWWN